MVFHSYRGNLILTMRKCHWGVVLLPTILIFRDTKVHIGVPNSNNISCKVEKSVDKAFGLTSSLEMIQIMLILDV